MSVSSPKTSIIIPVFNQLHYTKACFESLLQHTKFDSTDIIFVNNGSYDGTTEYLAELTNLHPQIVRTINFPENRGYSIANNEGAKSSNSDFYIFLNNDTEAQSNWFEGLLEVATTFPNVGVVGSKLLYPKTRKLNHIAYCFHKPTRAHYLLYQGVPEDHRGANRIREFKALLGACILVPRDVFSEIGGFSDFGLEDIDLCWKAKAKGYRVLSTAHSVLYHHGSITLANSKPGEIAANNASDFNRRWPPEDQCDDEEFYYTQDGLRLISFVGSSLEVFDARVQLEETIQKAQAAKEFDAAYSLELLNSALQNDPANPEAHFISIEILLTHGQEDQAILACESLINFHPHMHEAYVVLAELHMSKGNIVQCKEALDRRKNWGNCPDDFKDRVKALTDALHIE